MKVQISISFICISKSIVFKTLLGEVSNVSLNWSMLSNEKHFIFIWNLVFSFTECALILCSTSVKCFCGKLITFQHFVWIICLICFNSVVLCGWVVLCGQIVKLTLAAQQYFFIYNEVFNSKSLVIALHN